MDSLFLDSVNSPEDLKQLDFRQMEQLCQEIRAFLIESVSATGGHLSSNLGVVELTVALHRIFHSPRDAFVFDVGHQCYTHKIITGRKNDFPALRKKAGLSGFPAPHESQHDTFMAGHGSTSISAAIGMARAKKIKNEPGYVIAIIGDGAFTGGMIYEAINNAENLDNLILILNDNKMSISKNVGGLSEYLTKLRTSPGYYRAKNDVKTVLDKTPLVGQGIKKSIQSVKSSLRRGIYHSTFFEEMGFQYIGPIDGHNLPILCNSFHSAKSIQKPLFIHVETVKGKGFRPAEQNPGAFHGVSSFDVQNLTDPDISPSDSFSTVFGQTLAKLGEDNKGICAITAAMKYGTGLQYFKKRIPARFFDVGMAEQHAVTFAAGLARQGLVPVVSIYSTFLQRAYDQIIHDVMLQNLNVLFAIDRAGLVPGDGATHQGIYDAAFLSQQADMPLVSPSNYQELTHWLKVLLEDYNVPRAIRYPRGREPGRLQEKPCTGKPYDCLVQHKSPKAALVTYGGETADVLEAADTAGENELPVDVFQMIMINPVPLGLVDTLMGYPLVLFAEEGVAQGGIGEHLALKLYQNGYKGRFIHVAAPSTGIDHAEVPELKAEFGLDAKGIVKRLMEACR